jgi:hypothetical protein
MSSVSFVNDGLIDLTAVTTFGVNVKETENPFGFFGTGLKYAIAILLKKNHEITIYAGLDKHIFSVTKKEVRGKNFDLVCMDGRELGFTLELGKTWDMWQVFRELYCNTMDENGFVIDSKHSPCEGKTTVVVTGDDFYDEYINRNKTILSSTPKYSVNNLNIHQGQSDNLYFKTIRVADLPKESYFTYDFKQGIDLTEDRTIKYDWTAISMIRDSVLRGTNKAYMREFICCPGDAMEANIDMDDSSNPSDPSSEFLELMKDMDFKDISNPSLLSYYKKKTCVSKTPRSANLTDVEIKQISLAIKFCDSINYPVDKYRINVTEDLKTNVLGMAYEGEIYVSRRTFMQGTKQVVATVLEEFLHLEHGYHDETYEFQNYLFDVIVSLGERLNGEPI